MNPLTRDAPFVKQRISGDESHGNAAARKKAKRTGFLPENARDDRN